MSIKRTYKALTNIISRNGMENPDNPAIERGLRGVRRNRTRMEYIAVLWSRYVALSPHYFLYAIFVFFVLDFAGGKVEKAASVVSLSAVLVAGFISLVVLRTNYSLEMLKLKEKWVFSLRDDFCDYFFYINELANKVFDNYSKAMHYHSQSGFQVDEESLEKMKIDFHGALGKEGVLDYDEKAEMAFNKIVSKIDDGKREHHNLVLVAKIFHSILSDYTAVMSGDKMSVSDKVEAHNVFRSFIVSDFRVGRRMVSRELREIWDEDRHRKLKANKEIRSIYVLIIGVFLGLLVGLSDFSVLGLILSWFCF